MHDQIFLSHWMHNSTKKSEREETKEPTSSSTNEPVTLYSIASITNKQRDMDNDEIQNCNMYVMIIGT